MELMMQLAELGFPPERIQKALKATGSSSLDAALDYLQNEFDLANQEAPTEPAITESTEHRAIQAEPPAAEKLQKVIAEKRQLDAARAAQVENELELKRRQEGKEMLALKRHRETAERQKMLADRRKEMEEEKKRRERVLAMIAEDRENQKKFVPPESRQEWEESLMTEETNKQQQQQEIRRIGGNAGSGANVLIRGPAIPRQILLNISSDCTLDDVCAYIEQEFPRVMENSRLLVALPHREFSPEEYGKSLADLGLCNSAITVAPKK